MTDTRRYGLRSDELCGSWRSYGTPVREGGRPRRRVCTRPYHPGEDLHYTADGAWWWRTADRTARRTATDPRPANTTGRANRERNLPVTAAVTQPLTIERITTEVRTLNTDKGWRDLDTTWGDYIALLHTEIAEITEAYRDHRLADATDYENAYGDPNGGPPKPEGVGSELADVLIRLFDMCDDRGVPVCGDDSLSLADVTPLILSGVTPLDLRTVGDWCAELHHRADALWSVGHGAAPTMLRAIRAFADAHGIDLAAEYLRKMAYNRTRPYRHGGRTM